MKLTVNLLLILLCSQAFAADTKLQTGPQNQSEKPDIVVILADDIGLGDISFYAQQLLDKAPVINTPTIDALAKKGISFSDAHSATALCAPTRYAVMTGKNNYRSPSPWGVWGSFQKNVIEDTDITLGSVAKSAGYHTAFVGKWHLGGDFSYKQKNEIYRGTDEGYLPMVDLQSMKGGGPNNVGFDYSYMLPDGIQGPLYLAYENQKWAPLGEDSQIGFFNQESVVDQRIISDKGPGMADTAWRTQSIGNVISAKAAHAIKATPKNKALFMYYASPMAHLPHVPPEEFDGIKVANSTPSRHLDMVIELDLQVARIINALKDAGRYQNTIIIFTSDNGGLTYRVPGTLESGHKPSANFRSSKNAPHEGGHRVPFIVSWPKQIKQPKQNDSIVLVQDILSTVEDAARITIKKEDKLDSHSIYPLLTGNESNYQPRSYAMLQGGSRNELIYRYEQWKLIIQSDHKLSKFEPVALFDLETNLYEKEPKNLIKQAKYEELVDTMLARYLSIRESGQSTVP